MDGVGERKAEVRVEEAVNKEQKAEGRGGDDGGKRRAHY